MVRVVESTRVTKPIANCGPGENQRRGRSTTPSTALRTTSILEVKRGRGLICTGEARAGYLVAPRRHDRNANHPGQIIHRSVEALATTISDRLQRLPAALFPIQATHNAPLNRA